MGSKQLDDVGVNEYTPELRWGHTMNAAGEWVVVFGGHRRRGSLNDIALLDTDAPGQFRGADEVLAERPAGVGPR